MSLNAIASHCFLTIFAILDLLLIYHPIIRLRKEEEEEEKMKYYLIALTFAVVARAQPVADISCAVSCLSDVVITGECKPRHFDCVIRQCDAAVSLGTFDIPCFQKHL